MGQMMIIIMNQILKMGKMMSKLNNPFTPQQRLSLANEVYEKIMINNIKFKIKNKTVIFTDSKQIDNIEPIIRIGIDGKTTEYSNERLVVKEDETIESGITIINHGQITIEVKDNPLRGKDFD